MHCCIRIKHHAVDSSEKHTANNQSRNGVSGRVSKTDEQGMSQFGVKWCQNGEPNHSAERCQTDNTENSIVVHMDETFHGTALLTAVVSTFVGFAKHHTADSNQKTNKEQIRIKHHTVVSNKKNKETNNQFDSTESIRTKNTNPNTWLTTSPLLALVYFCRFNNHCNTPVRPVSIQQPFQHIDAGTFRYPFESFTPHSQQPLIHPCRSS